MTLRVLRSSLMATAAFLVCTTTAECRWAQVSGPWGGAITAFAWTAYGNVPDLFAGTFNGNVFRSSDDGASWEEADRGLSPGFSLINRLGLRCLAVVPGVSGNDGIMAGTNSGLFLSSDGGRSWVSFNGNLPPSGPYGTPSVASLLIVDTNIYAGTGSGIYLSTNGGLSWTVEDSGLSDSSIDCLAAGDSDIFAGTFSGVFVSTDHGRHWTLGHNGITSYDHVGALAAMGNRIFAGTDGAAYVSTDNGTTWTKVLDNYVTSFAVDGSDIYAGLANAGVAVSRDSGRTWSQLGLTNVFVQTLAVRTDRSGQPIILAGTANGVYSYTGRGSTWQAEGIANPYVMCLATAGTDLFAGTNGGIFVSTDEGASWTNSGPDSLQHPIGALAAYGDDVFAAPGGRGIFRSTDGGLNWTAVDSGLPGSSVTAIAVVGSTLYAGLAGPVIVIAGSSAERALTSNLGVYSSTDFGASWHMANSGLPAATVTGIAGNNSILFAQTQGGLFRSTDGGASWTYANNEFVAPGLNTVTVGSYAVYAGTVAGGILVSTDGGVNWSRSDSGLADKDIRSILEYGRNVFAATQSGKVFLSTDQAMSWSPVDSGLTAAEVDGLTILDGRLFAATAGAGVWSRPLSEMPLGIDIDSAGVPTSYLLSQNYPNPFNPTTVIRFVGRSSGSVSLKVYDVLGREVATLVDGRESAGTHSVVFNGAKFASGVYFYRLTAAGTNITRKMILVK